jgi:hypothetical protein
MSFFSFFAFALAAVRDVSHWIGFPIINPPFVEFNFFYLKDPGLPFL